LFCSDLKERVDKKNKDLDTLQQRIIEAADETRSMAEDRLRASTGGGRTPLVVRVESRNTITPGMLSDEDILGMCYIENIFQGYFHET